MKILQLQAENFKRLSAVEITPKGNVVTIAGKNAQGKSSILDSIWAVMQQSDAKVGMPIRKGAEKAHIRLSIGADKVEMIAERRYTATSSTLRVTSADGKATFNSPQKMLDALIGELSFDPLAFTRMDARKQFDELRRVAKLDTDIDALNAANTADFASRTDINRRAKAKRAQVDAIIVAPGLPEAKIDESEMLTKITEAAAANSDIEVRRSNRENARQQIITRNERAKELRAHAADLRRQADETDAKALAEEEAAADLQRKLDEAGPLPAPTDIEAIRVELDKAKAVNAAIDNRVAKERLEAEAMALEAESQKLTDAMAVREKAKLDAIGAATMPVEGLGFGDGIVTFNGVPFDQASGAEQLRVSMALAMAANPKLRVIRISDGSLLDEESMAIVAAMAKDKDYQVWLEKVDSTKKVGIVIEDGTVIAVNEEEPAEAAA